MGRIKRDEIIGFIEHNIQMFHGNRLNKLMKLKLGELLKRKNPYLFKAKYIITAPELVKTILDAYLSSQEEGIFGGFLEELAIFICGKVYNGKKSSAEGIDLEFNKEDIKYLVSIKSGPNWGNSRQVQKMKDDFKHAIKILSTNTPRHKIDAICGCCYGKDKNPDKGEYQKLCGQQFWKFISGDESLYVDIIEPLGNKAKEKNERFNIEYAKVVNKFTMQFAINFCDFDGNILWEKLVKYNSAKESDLKIRPLPK